MSDRLLARKKALSSLPGETVCRDVSLIVDTPMELLGLGFTRHSGPIPEALYPEDENPTAAAHALKQFASDEQAFTDALRLSVTLELHDRVVQTGQMRFQLSFDADGMPLKTFGRADFVGNGRAILFPGEVYTLKPERVVEDAGTDTGLTHEFDLWGRVDD